MTYPPQGYVSPQYVPPATRPPLTPRARRGAMLAGGLSFTMWNIGWALLGILAVVSLFGLLFSALTSSTNSNVRGREQLRDFGNSIGVSTFAGIGVIVGVVAVLLIVFSILVSGWILKANGVRSRWGVTWAGIGISVVANWIVGSIVSALGQLTTAFSASGRYYRSGIGFDFGGFLAGTAIWIGIVFVAQVLIGVFVWWWMAHVMRPRATAIATPATTSTENY